jgi:hypothetical protein
VPAPAGTGDVEQALLDQVPGKQALVQRRVENDDACLEGKTACEVQDGSRDVGDLESVDRGDLVITQSRDVAPEHAGGLTGGGWSPGDVHTVQPGAPQRESQEHRG